MRRVISSVWMLCLILTGCELAGAQLQEEVRQQAVTITELQQELVDKREDLEQMMDKLEELKKLQDEHEQTMQRIDAEGRSFMSLLLSEYPWLEKFRERTIWDRIVISRYEGDPEAAVIEDPLIIGHMANPYYCVQHVTTEGYPNGYPMNYVFDFYDGAEQNTLVLVDQYALLVEQHQLLLWPDCDLYQAVEAFMPALPFAKDDGLVAKLGASGAVRRGDAYVQFADHRVHLRVWPLVSEEVELLAGKPEQIGDRIERLTFYYHGEELYMDVYRQHVHLIGSGEEWWYYHEWAEEAFLLEPG
jgi:Uncharacterized protein conserved in bacteria